MMNFRRLLLMASAILCAVLLILLLADAIWPLANLFLSAFVKALLLVTCLVSAACGIMLIAHQRARMRGHRRPYRY